MIPKIIHYCWFGGKAKPRTVIDCINTWKKVFPDFEIKEWNESNFDVNALPYVKEAYYAKKYAFVADIARIVALITEGGLYFDTDVMVLKRFPDEILDKKAFIGFESDKEQFTIATAVIGSTPRHPFFIKFLQSYKNTHFFIDNNYNEETNVDRITRMLGDNGLLRNNQYQTVCDLHIYPNDFFSNYDFSTRQPYSSENSLARHLYFSSWKDNKSSFILRRKADLNKLYYIYSYYLLSSFPPTIFEMGKDQQLPILVKLKEILALKKHEIHLNSLLKKQYRDVTDHPTYKEGEKHVISFLACDYNNLGDFIIRKAEEKLIKKIFKNHTFIAVDYTKTSLIHYFSKVVNKDDIITISGGGFMGSIYPGAEILRNIIIKSFPNNKIISFPQSLSFEDNPRGECMLNYSKKTSQSHNNLLVLMREIKSYQKFTSEFISVKSAYVCDSALTDNYLEVYPMQRNVVTLCFRSDIEKSVSESKINDLIKWIKEYTNIEPIQTDFLVEDKIYAIEELDALLEERLYLFRHSKFVMTDRLHGMIAAYLTGTPVIVLPNNNPKIKYTYFNWLSDCDYILFLEELDYDKISKFINKPFMFNEDEFLWKQQLFTDLISSHITDFIYS